jgi:hypothetical protein
MQKNPDLVRFNILRNALYHSARRRSLERVNRAFNFLIVVLGTAAFGDLTKGIGVGAEWIGAAVAVVGAFQLVFDFGRQSRDHQILQKSYYDLLADAEAKTDPSEVDAAAWHAEMLRITANEPPVLKAIDATAYNDAIDAMDFDPKERLVIPVLDQLFGWFITSDGRQYLKVAEVEELKEKKKAAREARRAKRAA